MKKYYLSTTAQPNGDHEVHTEYCTYLPLSEDRIFLGGFHSCANALFQAKKRNPDAKINGCRFCSAICHTN